MPPPKKKKKTRLEAETLLPEVIRRLLSISEPEVLLRQVLTLANEALGADEVSLLLLDASGHELVEHEVVGKKLRPTRDRRRRLEEGIVGWVASHRLPQVVADVRMDQRCPKGQGDTRSEAAVPILSGEKLLGVLDFESRKAGYFQKGDLTLLAFLASQVAIALRMVELDDRAREWQERMSALHNLLRLGGGSVPQEALLRRVVDTVRNLCGGHYSAVFLGDYDREELVLLAQSSAKPVNIAVASRLKFRTGLTGKAFEIGETVNVRDVRNESMYVDRIPGVLSEVCVPLRMGDRCVGILDAQAPNVGEFTADEVLFLEAVARLLAPQIASAAAPSPAR
jgi:putative methionine-R-sulfoxide reductase with GAF domain